MEAIKITHYLNGNLYEDDFIDAINEYDNPNTAFYVLATDKDVAEDAIFEGGNWIKDLAVKEIINYVPKQELSLRFPAHIKNNKISTHYDTHNLFGRTPLYSRLHKEESR